MRRAVALTAPLLACAPAAAQEAPDIAEPMVFDLVRPLGAKRGELEVNTLAQRDLSGPSPVVEWAPEVELAVADGFAVELELPFENRRLTDLKLGLQGTFSLLDGGRGIHGVQYLGLWNRAHRRWESSLLYVIGYRFGARVSTLSMVGIGDVSAAGAAERALLVNHTSFYAAGDDTTIGVEVNVRAGRERSTLVMPQLHQALSPRLEVQAGLGARRETGDTWHPRAGIRLVRSL
ncbi:hypothetical protein [Sphingomonas sp. BK069]|uniref:hypothetical protein n=1 Tax=Sphingomonas sp. BK069 TaxID=2586979 RepID=UPI0018145E98|nr:hypothetical protein [Sphingomonas sp. BK069]MBB3347198.1 hypothetical protein [Sphingomonas sp. BK069]